MPIDYFKRSARLRGVVSVDEAEALTVWIQQNPKAKLNLAQCSHLHCAVLQALMALRPEVSAWPAAPDLHAFLHSTLVNPNRE